MVYTRRCPARTEIVRDERDVVPLGVVPWETYVHPQYLHNSACTFCHGVRFNIMFCGIHRKMSHVPRDPELLRLSGLYYESDDQMTLLMTYDPTMLVTRIVSTKTVKSSVISFRAVT